ncbi:NUDIX domain-containing protein [Candidatus Dojkabacteria bacterium]|nr:NUDIX domain-containing protein [Candidatus Dojkabacteria bacterium]
MKQLHPLQLKILRELLFNESLRYLQLKPDEVLENSKFDFHLKKMIEVGYVENIGREYQLTNSGKEYANTMDTDQVRIMKQGKITVLHIGYRYVDQELEVLMYTRLKEPFYGCQGFPAGKVRYGELVEEAASREFQEETGYIGKAEKFAIGHYVNLEKVSDRVIEDKYMFFCRIKDPSGSLVGSEEGKYEWVPQSKLKDYLKRPFESYDEVIKVIKLLKKFDGGIVMIESRDYPEHF